MSQESFNSENFPVLFSCALSEPDDLPKHGGVYVIKCEVDGKIYVGSTGNNSGFRKRIKRHVYDLKRDRHHSKRLQAAYSNYGESAFRFFVLEKVPDTVLKSREQYYLDTLCPHSPSRGFNTAAFAHAPSRGRRQSASSIEKRKLAFFRKSPEERERIRNRLKEAARKWERSATPEEKESLREKHRLSYFDDKNRNSREAAVAIFWADTSKTKALRDSRGKAFELQRNGVIFKGKNLQDFCRDQGLPSNALSFLFSRKIKPKHMFGWQRVGEPSVWRLVTSPSGEVYSFYDGTKFAAAHGLSRQSLSALVRGKIKQHKGWTLTPKG